MKNKLNFSKRNGSALLRSLCFYWMVIFGWTTLPTAANGVAASATVETSPIKRPAPKYPEYALKHQLEGAVLVNFSIEQDGGVSDIEVMAADQDGLFDATTILAIQKWVYNKPAHKIRNNYIAIEYVLSDNSNVSQFSNVEKIQIRGK